MFLAVGAAAVVLVAAIAAAGMFTNWFGLASGGNGLYVLKSSVSYTRDNATADSYAISHKNEYEIDEHGNRAALESDSYKDGQVTGWTKTEYSLDESGFSIGYTSSGWIADGDVNTTSEATIRNDFDSKGRVARASTYFDVSGPSAGETEYSYYENGRLKSTAYHADNINTSQITTYDERGYVSGFAYEYGDVNQNSSFVGTKSSSTEFTWEFDSSNRPVSYKTETTIISIEADGKETRSVSEADFEVSVDSSGNITAISSNDGETRTEFEYIFIDDASLAARSIWTMPFRLQ